MKNIPKNAYNKTISMHPLATIGMMFVFAYPAIAISHSTDSLATHKHIKDLALTFSAAFFAFFTIILLLQLAAELEKIKGANNYSVPGLLFSFIVFALGFCVAVGGAIASSVIIKVLDSNIASQAKVISQQTAAINYVLIAGAVLMLAGYALARYSMKNANDKSDNPSLCSLGAMRQTSSLWFLLTMGLGIAGAFTLKSAPQVSNTEIIAYSTMLFFAAVVIGMPKIIYALKTHNDEGHAMTGKMFYSLLFLPLFAFAYFGAGITSAVYGDPLYGSILVVVGMLPLALAGILADSASSGIQPKFFDKQRDDDYSVNSPKNDKLIDDDTNGLMTLSTN